MRKIILTTSLMLAAIVAFAQNGAVIEFKMSSSHGANGTMKGYYSNQNCRMEMQMSVAQMPNAGFNTVTLIKAAEPNKVYTIIDKNKTYMVMDVPPSTSEKPEEYTVTVIGKDKIAGYDCIHVRVNKGTDAMDFWTTKAIGDYEKYNKANSNHKSLGSGSIYAALKKYDADGFIVKSQVKDQKGGDLTTELIKFEKKDVDAGLFTIPADYKQTSNVMMAPGAPGQNIDIQKIQNMTPEEREKYIEEMKKQYGTPPSAPKQN